MTAGLCPNDCPEVFFVVGAERVRDGVRVVVTGAWAWA